MFGLELTTIAALIIIAWYALNFLGYLIIFIAESKGIFGIIVGIICAMLWPFFKSVDSASKF